MAFRDRKKIIEEKKSRENRDTIKQAALKQAAVSSASRLTREQKYMLTHLTPAQMKAWNAYSPAHQQKIMQDVQRRVDRRMSGDRSAAEDRPEKNHHTREYFFPEEYVPDNTVPVNRIYRARGHPPEMVIRTVREAEFRQKKAEFRGRMETAEERINGPGPEPGNIGKVPATKGRKSSDNYIGRKRSFSRKNIGLYEILYNFTNEKVLAITDLLSYSYECCGMIAMTREVAFGIKTVISGERMSS